MSRANDTGPFNSYSALARQANDNDQQLQPQFVQVRRFKVLYTTKYTQKTKVWNDGYMTFHLFNGKCIIYDSRKNRISEGFEAEKNLIFFEEIKLYPVIFTIEEEETPTMTDVAPIIQRSRRPPTSDDNFSYRTRLQPATTGNHYLISPQRAPPQTPRNNGHRGVTETSTTPAALAPFKPPIRNPNRSSTAILNMQSNHPLGEFSPEYTAKRAELLRQGGTTASKRLAEELHQSDKRQRLDQHPQTPVGRLNNQNVYNSGGSSTTRPALREKEPKRKSNAFGKNLVIQDSLVLLSTLKAPLHPSSNPRKSNIPKQNDTASKNINAHKSGHIDSDSSSNHDQHPRGPTDTNSTTKNQATVSNVNPRADSSYDDFDLDDSFFNDTGLDELERYLEESATDTETKQHEDTATQQRELQALEEMLLEDYRNRAKGNDTSHLRQLKSLEPSDSSVHSASLPDQNKRQSNTIDAQIQETTRITPAITPAKLFGDDSFISKRRPKSSVSKSDRAKTKPDLPSPFDSISKSKTGRSLMSTKNQPLSKFKPRPSSALSKETDVNHIEPEPISRSISNEDLKQPNRSSPPVAEIEKKSNSATFQSPFLQDSFIATKAIRREANKKGQNLESKNTQDDSEPYFTNGKKITRVSIPAHGTHQDNIMIANLPDTLNDSSRESLKEHILPDDIQETSNKPVEDIKKGDSETINLPNPEAEEIKWDDAIVDDYIYTPVTLNNLQQQNVTPKPVVPSSSTKELISASQPRIEPDPEGGSNLNPTFESEETVDSNKGVFKVFNDFVNFRTRKPTLKASGPSKASPDLSSYDTNAIDKANESRKHDTNKGCKGNVNNGTITDTIRDPESVVPENNIPSPDKKQPPTSLPNPVLTDTDAEEDSDSQTNKSSKQVSPHIGYELDSEDDDEIERALDLSVELSQEIENIEFRFSQNKINHNVPLTMLSSQRPALDTINEDEDDDDMQETPEIGDDKPTDEESTPLPDENEGLENSPQQPFESKQSSFPELTTDPQTGVSQPASILATTAQPYQVAQRSISNTKFSLHKPAHYRLLGNPRDPNTQFVSPLNKDLGTLLGASNPKPATTTRVRAPLYRQGPPQSAERSNSLQNYTECLSQHEHTNNNKSEPAGFITARIYSDQFSTPTEAETGKEQQPDNGLSSGPSRILHSSPAVSAPFVKPTLLPPKTSTRTGPTLSPERQEALNRDVPLKEFGAWTPETLELMDWRPNNLTY